MPPPASCTGSTSSPARSSSPTSRPARRPCRTYPEMVGAVAQRTDGGIVAAVAIGLRRLRRRRRGRPARRLPPRRRAHERRQDRPGRPLLGGQLRDGLRRGSRRPLAPRRRLRGDARAAEPDPAERPGLEPVGRHLLPRRDAGAADPELRVRPRHRHDRARRLGPRGRRRLPRLSRTGSPSTPADTSGSRSSPARPCTSSRPDGERVRTMPIPTSQTTSCAFVGPDLDELWVTSAGVGIDPDVEPDAGSIFRVTGLGVDRPSPRPPFRC